MSTFAKSLKKFKTVYYRLYHCKSKSSLVIPETLIGHTLLSD